MNKQAKITAMLLVLALCAVAQADELLVPAEYLTIQAAINAAVNGDTVIVADGTYTGDGNRDIDFLGKAITVRSTDPNDPNIVAATIIDCNGTEDDPHRGFYFQSGEDGNSALDGLTITNGFAEKGGGIQCINSSPTITNCAINDNIAGSGGGIYCENSSPTIKNCIINNNLAQYGGGGVWCYKSILTITNCIINGNRASRDEGGGISCWESNLTIANCILNSNSAEWVGGGISCVFCPEDGLTIANCTLNKNSARWNGGGIWCGHVIGPAITNCEFNGNSAEFGGAVECFAIENGIISNCVFSNNSAKFGGALNYGLIPESTLTNCIISGNKADNGGGVYCTRSSPNIFNCTFAENSATNGSALACGSGSRFRSSNLKINNCIFWDGGNEIANLDVSTITIAYSDVQSGWSGQGNIDADPCFVDPGYWDSNGIWIGGDYHLLRTSPCVDAGTDANVYTDIEGNVRPFDFPGVDNNGELPEFDMGAYEIVPVEAAMKLTPQMVNCNSKGNLVKAHLTLPEGFLPEDVDVNEPAVAEPMGAESESIKVLGAGTGPVKLEICFDREAFCDSVTETGEVEITVIGSLTTSRYFYGSDTIRIIP